MKKRKSYLDAVKLFAIFIVFATHFIAAYRDSLFMLWDVMPYALFLKGISGKFGVVIFSVILGYFAYRSSEKNIVKYTIKRYLYFLICALFINSLYACVGHLGIYSDPVSVRQVLITSVKLGDDIFPTFWCIIPFLLGSVLSRINGLVNDRTGTGVILPLIEIAVLVWLDQQWVAICLMGNIAALIESNEKLMKPFLKRAVRILIYLIAFFAIKQPSADIRYLVDGVAVLLVIPALSGSSVLTKVLDCRALASPGKNTMAIYLIHVVIYHIIGDRVIDASASPSSFLLSFVVSWAVIVLLSYPVNALLNRLSKIAGKPVDKLFGPKKTLEGSDS